MPIAERLYLQERLDQILALVQEQGRVSVADLSEQFEVSTVTIRTDLATLEQQGELVRTHGGAVARTRSGTEPAFALRRQVHVAQKERIGRFAAALVDDGDAIALDASTTALHVARHLKNRHELTVVTNGLLTAMEFLDAPGVMVVMPGGSLRPASASLVGDQGACILGQYHVQKGFFGAGGLTLREGLTDLNQYEVDLKRRMAARSKEIIAVVDASKWGRVTFASFASVDQISAVITDEGAPPDMVAALQAQGIGVTLA
jgi:DeoR/GlpR family transcriptional regulator of sugar metabolism